MTITRIQLIDNGEVFEVGVVSKFLKTAKGKSQRVKEIHLTPSDGVPIIGIIGEAGTSVNIFGASRLYSQVSDD